MEEKQYIVDALSADESWRVFRIMAEFVEAIEELSEIGHAVSIFGSAREAPGDRYYEKARKVARLLGEEGFSVITGGGPGIMEAANRGASEAGARSVGMNIQLPFEQTPNSYANIILLTNISLFGRSCLSSMPWPILSFPGDSAQWMNSLRPLPLFRRSG